MRRVNLLHAHGSPTGYMTSNGRSCRCVSCCATQADHHRKYRAEHAEETADYSRKYYVEHAEEIAERSREHRAKHAERIAGCKRKYNAEHTEERRRYRMRRDYGIGLSEWDAMLAAQGNSCAICGTTQPGGRVGTWCTDHDHDTGTVRGILCHHCNTGIGHFRDDPERLMAAIEYLRAVT